MEVFTLKRRADLRPSSIGFSKWLQPGFADVTGGERNSQGGTARRLYCIRNQAVKNQSLIAIALTITTRKIFTAPSPFRTDHLTGEPSAKGIADGENQAVFPIDLVVDDKDCERRNGVDKGHDHLDGVALDQGKMIDPRQDQEGSKNRFPPG